MPGRRARRWSSGCRRWGRRRVEGRAAVAVFGERLVAGAVAAGALRPPPWPCRRWCRRALRLDGAAVVRLLRRDFASAERRALAAAAAGARRRAWRSACSAAAGVGFGVPRSASSAESQSGSSWSTGAVFVVVDAVGAGRRLACEVVGGRRRGALGRACLRQSWSANALPASRRSRRQEAGQRDDQCQSGRSHSSAPRYPLPPTAEPAVTLPGYPGAQATRSPGVGTTAPAAPQQALNQAAAPCLQRAAFQPGRMRSLSCCQRAAKGGWRDRMTSRSRATTTGFGPARSRRSASWPRR